MDSIFKEYDENKLKVVFVFDEVRALLKEDKKEDQFNSPFACMRRAARYFPEKKGLAVVILDTVSRVSNLTPHSSLDPSYRPRETDNCKLFSPIFALPTIDSFDEPVKEGRDELSALLAPHVIYKYGRPLWKALLPRNS